jgi:hypothetical protein
MCSIYKIAIAAVVVLLAIEYPAHADVIVSPMVSATSVEHSYFVGGKSTIRTTIEDTVHWASSPAWSPVWHNPATWVSTISAPDGYQFVVTPAPSFGVPTIMNVETNWNVSTPVLDYTVFFSTSSYVFDGVTGNQPIPVASGSVAGQALYTLGARASNYAITEPFSFKSVTFTTTPPYDLEAFPVQTYYSSPRLNLSISGQGSYSDYTLISLQPVPEPGSYLLLASGGLLLVVFDQIQRRA